MHNRVFRYWRDYFLASLALIALDLFIRLIFLATLVIPFSFLFLMPFLPDWADFSLYISGILIIGGAYTFLLIQVFSKWEEKRDAWRKRIDAPVLERVRLRDIEELKRKEEESAEQLRQEKQRREYARYQEEAQRKEREQQDGERQRRQRKQREQQGEEEKKKWQHTGNYIYIYQVLGQPWIKVGMTKWDTLNRMLEYSQKYGFVPDRSTLRQVRIPDILDLNSVEEELHEAMLRFGYKAIPLGESRELFRFPEHLTDFEEVARSVQEELRKILREHMNRESHPHQALYRLLGLNPGASHEAIKAAWRRAAQIYHPDKGGNPEIFKKARQAYETLSKDM